MFCFCDKNRKKEEIYERTIFSSHSIYVHADRIVSIERTSNESERETETERGREPDTQTDEVMNYLNCGVGFVLCAIWNSILFRSIDFVKSILP